jgi:hypothetical protein
MKPGFVQTDDSAIRSALRKVLADSYAKDTETRVIEELPLTCGRARVDIAVVNGVIHGYELKSDIDTLMRLPSQMKAYNHILDQVTLVVGKSHLYEAIRIVPDWWGIVIAKAVDTKSAVAFCNIREAGWNPTQDYAAIASLLWRSEALSILESVGMADGIRSKRRSVVYERLAQVLDKQTLKWHVRRSLFTRTSWRSVLPYMPDGD